MDLSIQLSDGSYLLAADEPDKVVFGFLNPDLSFAPSSDTVIVRQANDWIGLAATSAGGFTLSWQDPTTKILWAQDYNASAQALDSAYVITTPPPSALQAFPAIGSSGYAPNMDGTNGAYLSDGGHVSYTLSGGNSGGNLTIQKTAADGSAVGSPFAYTTSDNPGVDYAAVAPTAETGGYVAVWADSQDSPNFTTDSTTVRFARFSGSGAVETQQTLANLPGADDAYFQVVGLADGGFVVAYTPDYVGPTHPTYPVYVAEYSAQGQLVFSDSFQAGFLESLNALPDGRYALTFTAGSFDNTTETRTYAEQGAALGTADPPPAGYEDLVAGPSTTLTASAGWAQDHGVAAVLSNGALAMVEAQGTGGGWAQGAEQTYDANGNETASATLLGAGPTLSPEIAALPVGGFYEVTYAGSSNYEVYNANDQLVFFHNQYTSPTASFGALANGGYVTTDSGSSVFGLFDASNDNVGWFSMPSDAPGAATANALNGGGFVFTYAGTSHFDLYDASGDLLAHGDLSATGSSFATGFASLAGNGDGFLEAWLSPDGSTYNGVATSLDVQAMGPMGAITPVITITQDLDPWHTVFDLQAHADGSVAVLWSEGGAVFGAEYANGAVGPAYTAAAGSLSASDAIQLPGDKVGLAYIQNGDVYAEIFDPATGAVSRADLGVSNGDLSGVHALATASGGMAVSWHDSAANVLGAVLAASGQASAAMTLPGDLLGVDSAGQAVTIHDDGAGTPVLQTFTLNDGLFWVA